MVKYNIKLEELSENSTPCQICVAVNKREIEPDPPYYCKNNSVCSKDQANYCLDSDKAMIKLLYLISELYRG